MPLEIELLDASGRSVDRIRKRASGDVECRLADPMDTDDDP